MIFKDTEMSDLLEIKPKTLKALGEIKGFPASGKRVEKWGQAIIDIFNKTDKVEDFEVELDGNGDVIVRTKMKPMSVF